MDRLTERLADALRHGGGVTRTVLGRPVFPGSRLRTFELLQITWFSALTAKLLVLPQLNGPIHPPGVDAIVYAHAARALLDGGDPWFTSVTGIFYAAPPPSLVPYLPLAWLPDAFVAALGIGVALASAVYALRRLGMPMWWLLFPPTAIGIFAGSSALPVLAFLVRGGVIADAAAIVIRVYAGLPLATLGRWRGLIAGVAFLLVSAPFLGFGTFFNDREQVFTALDAQAGSGISATSIPILVPIVGVLLVLLGRRRAAWLLVPFLWPAAQLHYASIAMPVLAEMPAVAIGLAPYSAITAFLGLAAQVGMERVTAAGLPVWRRSGSRPS